MSPIRSVPALLRPGAAGRQCHRLYLFEYGIERQMAGTAQGDRAKRDAGGGPSGSRDTPRGSASSPPSNPRRHRSVEVSPVNVRDAGEIERAVAAFARSPNGGLIVTASALACVHRDLIITLAARHKLPAVYFRRFFVTGGGLISYGPISSTSSGARPATSIASSRAKTRPTCRCRRRPSTSW